MFHFMDVIQPGITVWRTILKGIPDSPNIEMGSHGSGIVYTMPFARNTQTYEPCVNWYRGLETAFGAVTYLNDACGSPLAELPESWFGLQIAMVRSKYMIAIPLVCRNIQDYIDFRKSLVESGFAMNPWHKDAPRFKVNPELYRMYCNNLNNEWKWGFFS